MVLGFQPSQMAGVPTNDDALKAEDQMHKHQIDKARLALDAEKQQNDTQQQDFNQTKEAAQFEHSVVQSEQSNELANKQADSKAQGGNTWAKTQ